MERRSDNNQDKILQLRFLGSTAQDSQPKVALFSIDTKGGITSVRKLQSLEGNKISLSELARNVKEGVSYGFGPDIGEAEVRKDLLFTFRPKEKIREWADTGVIEITPKWRDWIMPITCVHGDVHRCHFILPPIITIAATKKLTANSGVTSSSALKIGQGVSDPLYPKFPELFPICAPVCNAVVEVYEKTCCCTIRPFDIDSLLDRIRELLERIPPIPPIDPEGPIGPIPGPDPAPFGRDIAKTAKLAQASTTKIPLGIMPERLVADYQTLSTMPPEKRLDYINARDYLYPIFCTCSSRKVGETPVNEDGEFSLCYFRGLTKSGCKTTYYYKVRQWQENQWVYIYDGLTTNEYFKASDDAHLRTWKGLACRPEGGINPGGDFVMLENIGSTPSWRLASPTQDSELGVSSANPADGLTKIGQPWGKTLHFRLKFSEGLKALGAKYYRVSVVKANSSGDPESGAVPQPLTNPVAWRRWINVGGQIKSEAITLGPLVAPNGTSALYLIPYEADAPFGWLWFQYHQTWNTTAYDNTKHLVIVEIFDANGNRLKPNGAPGSDIAKPFTFRRWIDEENTTTVNFAALTHMFHVDNIKCYGDIVDFRKNGVPSTAECQFIAGCATDNFSVGMYAFHVNGFMSSYHLWYPRGLNGPNVTLETGTTNAPAGIPPIPSPLDSTNAKQSSSKTFDEMLGPHDKCSFSIELRVYPKHTDGFGTIWEYGASDTAAVALEKVLCISNQVTAIPARELSKPTPSP